MSTIFMKLETSESSHPYKLVLKSVLALVRINWIYKEVINVVHYQTLISSTRDRI